MCDDAMFKYEECDQKLKKASLVYDRT